MAEILPEIETFARIKVVGVGGGGGNAINRMVQSKLRGIDFVAINTDAQALHYSQANKKVHIGKETTKGLGAGANPEVGRMAAEESEAEIFDALKNTEMVFITTGMGGGTGSGASPVVARIAREIGALTVAIVTKPFTFEGDRRMKICEAGIEELKGQVDALIVIPNDRILQVIDRKTSLLDAFGTVDDVLKQGVQGIADLIGVNAIVNLDFADVESIMKNAGSALMGIGQGSGDTRAVDAVKEAIESPLLEVSITGAQGVLINFTGGRDMGMHEVEEAAKLVHDSIDPDANIIFGTVIDENLTGEIRVTLVATGFDGQKSRSIGEFNAYKNHTIEDLNRPDFSSLENETSHAQFLRQDTNNLTKPILDDTTKPFVQAEAEEALESVDTSDSVMQVEIDNELLAQEGMKKELQKNEPIVETVNSELEYDEDDLDKPAFLRKGVKISQPDKATTKNPGLNASGQAEDESIPSFIRRKL